MPYKSESIKLTGLQDRRRKLTDEQRKDIIDMYATGYWSLSKLAEHFEVSKKTVLLLVNKKSAENAKKYRKENWKEYQQSKEERTKATRNTRRYKQSLYVSGQLVENKEDQNDRSV